MLTEISINSTDHIRRDCPSHATIEIEPGQVIPNIQFEQCPEDLADIKMDDEGKVSFRLPGDDEDDWSPVNWASTRIREPRKMSWSSPCRGMEGPSARQSSGSFYGSSRRERGW